MKFLHQTGDTIPVDMNNIVKLMLTEKYAYYYDEGTLKSYLRDQVLITYEYDNNAIKSFNVGNARVLHFVKGDNDILHYLKKRLSKNEYFEFERFLFERT
jgi:hypothetical protein